MGEKGGLRKECLQERVGGREKSCMKGPFLSFFSSTWREEEEVTTAARSEEEEEKAVPKKAVDQYSPSRNQPLANHSLSPPAELGVVPQPPAQPNPKQTKPASPKKDMGSKQPIWVGGKEERGKKKNEWFFFSSHS